VAAVLGDSPWVVGRACWRPPGGSASSSASAVLPSLFRSSTSSLTHCTFPLLLLPCPPSRLLHLPTCLLLCVQIWSTRTGLLQASCRGHDAEINDLAVSCDNALVASSSMDGTVRVWQLEVGRGGPQGLLAGGSEWLAVVGCRGSGWLQSTLPAPWSAGAPVSGSWLGPCACPLWEVQSASAAAEC